jgi:hypothetical protein
LLIAGEGVDYILRAAFQAAHNPILKFKLRTLGQLRPAMNAPEQGRGEKRFNHRDVVNDEWPNGLDK